MVIRAYADLADEADYLLLWTNRNMASPRRKDYLGHSQVLHTSLDMILHGSHVSTALGAYEDELKSFMTEARPLGEGTRSSVLGKSAALLYGMLSVAANSALNASGRHILERICQRGTARLR